jgi:hypothetical protein
MFVGAGRVRPKGGVLDRMAQSSTALLVWATLVIWLVAFVGGVAPIVVASYNKVMLALCNSFAAGEHLPLPPPQRPPHRTRLTEPDPRTQG